jgi:hypothetical protein
MPLVACPKCATNLKIPDGASGNVKCPKCNNIFSVSAPAAPAFEVVEDQAPKPARPAAKPQPMEPDFEVVDEPKRKKRDDDDDDDRPRKKRRDDDDDDDDRPRSKRRRDDDYDDDDDRRKKKKKRRRDYDDDDDWQPRGRSNPFGPAKVGVLLLSISFWMYLASFALIALYILIAWAGSGETTSSRSPRDDSSSSFEFFATLPGIIGLGNWIVALVGLGFCIAGPARARSMAITATVLAGVHLVLVGITFSNIRDGGGGAGAARGLGFGSIAWIFVSSALPALDAFLPTLFYASRAINGEMVIAILAGICEVLRLVFVLMTIKALAEAAKDYEASEKAMVGMFGTLIVVGVAALLILLLVVLIDAKAFTSLRTVMNLGMGVLFVVYLAYTAMLIMPALVALMTKSSLAHRAR